MIFVTSLFISGILYCVEANDKINHLPVSGDAPHPAGQQHQGFPENPVLQLFLFPKKTRWQISRAQELDAALEHVRFKTNAAAIEIFNIKSMAFCHINTDETTGNPVPSFCMEGDRHSTMMIHQYIDMGNKRYLCLQWLDPYWKPSRHEMGMPRLIFIPLSRNGMLGEVYFQDQHGQPYGLPCGVSKAIVRKEDNRIITEFANRQGERIDLEYRKCRVTRIERTSDHSGHPVFYLGEKRLNFSYHQQEYVPEKVIYHLWLIIDIITSEKMQMPASS